MLGIRSWIDDPTGDCFFSIPSFIFWDSCSGQHFVPGNRPCTGEVPVPDKDGRRRGALCPPHPSKTAPPLPPFFLVLVQGRRTELGRAGVFSSRGCRLLPTSAPFAPLCAVRLPLTHTCRLLNERKARAGPVRWLWGILRAAFPWIEPGPGGQRHLSRGWGCSVPRGLFPKEDPRGSAN